MDVGTGTGLIALMLAQRTKTSVITGVEIDPRAASQATDNAQQSIWNERLHVVCQDLKLFKPTNKFEEIISNPPFYLHSPSSSSHSRDLARRTTPRFYEDMVSFVQTYLADDGVFEVILPADAAEDFVFLCWQYDLFLKKHTKVYTKEGKTSKRSLLSFTSKEQPADKENLYMMDGEGIFTPEYSALIKDFYLDKD